MNIPVLRLLYRACCIWAAVLVLLYWDCCIGHPVLVLQHWYSCAGAPVLGLFYWDCCMETAVVSLLYWDCCLEAAVLRLLYLDCCFKTPVLRLLSPIQHGETLLLWVVGAQEYSPIKRDAYFTLLYKCHYCSSQNIFLICCRYRYFEANAYFLCLTCLSWS